MCIKFVDWIAPTAVLGTAAGTAATIYPLNGVRQGTGNWNRTGRYVNFIRMEVNISFELEITNPSLSYDQPSLLVRFVLDHQPNGASTIFYNDIFQYVTSAGVQANLLQSGIAVKNYERFKEIDTQYYDPATGASSTSTVTGAISTCYTFRQTYDFNIRTLFTSNNETDESISTNQIWGVFRSVNSINSLWRMLGGTIRFYYEDS